MGKKGKRAKGKSSGGSPGPSKGLPSGMSSPKTNNTGVGDCIHANNTSSHKVAHEQAEKIKGIRACAAKLKQAEEALEEYKSNLYYRIIISSEIQKLKNELNSKTADFGLKKNIDWESFKIREEKERKLASEAFWDRELRALSTVSSQANNDNPSAPVSSDTITTDASLDWWPETLADSVREAHTAASLLVKDTQDVWVVSLSQKFTEVQEDDGSVPGGATDHFDSKTVGVFPKLEAANYAALREFKNRYHDLIENAPFHEMGVKLHNLAPANGVSWYIETNRCLSLAYRHAEDDKLDVTSYCITVTHHRLGEM